VNALPIPESAFRQIKPTLDQLDPKALLWLSGYCAGLSAPGLNTGGLIAPTDTAAAPAWIVYGSQTGNAKRLAERLAAQCADKQIPHHLANLSKFTLKQLSQAQQIFFVISTQGEGEPPDDAKEFLTRLKNAKPDSLSTLSFGVLALGDSSYPQFCATGHQVHQALVSAGATAVWPVAECDVDTATVADPWIFTALNFISANALPTSDSTGIAADLSHAKPAPSATYDNPLPITLSQSHLLTSSDASDPVLHLEFALPTHGFDYEPGDSLGIYAPNPASLITLLLKHNRLDPNEVISSGTQSHRLTDWLASYKDLTRISKALLTWIGEHHEPAFKGQLLGQLIQSKQVDAKDQVIDLFQRFSIQLSAAELLQVLLNKTPRLYSISSDPTQTGEIHLTVKPLRYSHRQWEHIGATSTALTSLPPNATVNAFIEKNERFRLPANPRTDIICIAAGTRIAPFRAFIQARRTHAERGRSWVIFGSRHRETDFLYQQEWLDALRHQELTQFSAAFSRDQPEKVYVQHKIKEHASELWAWLQKGAHLYICGQANPMATDVQQTLLEVIQTEGGFTATDAKAYLDHLATEQRYSKDVY
jgi:sulfite reductase (NADPH) flavoprotein alpha-component